MPYLELHKRTRFKHLFDKLSCAPSCVKLSMRIGAGPPINMVVRTNNDRLLQYVRLETIDFAKTHQLHISGGDGAAETPMASRNLRSTLLDVPDVELKLFEGGSLPANVELQFMRLNSMMRPGSPRRDAKSYEPWRDQPLLDGVVSQKLHYFSNDEVRRAASVSHWARAFHVPFPVARMSPFFAHNTNYSQWCMFGANPIDVASTRAALAAAYWSQVLLRSGGVLVRGDCICRSDDGRCVLFVGPKKCGKTTLALHCLHQLRECSLVGVKRLALFSNDLTSRESSVSVAGDCLCQAEIGLGTALGTVLPNPPLQKLVSPTHAATFARNSLASLWNLPVLPTLCHLSEAFGVGRRTSFSPKVVAVVYLGWSVPPLSSAGCTLIRTITEPTFFEGHVEDVCDGLHLLSGLQARFDAHSAVAVSLLNSIPNRIELGGEVRFDSAIGLVRRLLS